MKKAKRFLAVLLAVCTLMVSVAIPASAADSHGFSFNFPGQLANSRRSSSAYIRKSGTASVTTDVTTVKTMYVLTPSRESETLATNAVYRTYAGTSNFSWRSDYGGAGGDYRLTGCPSMDLGKFNAYDAYGSFAL